MAKRKIKKVIYEPIRQRFSRICDNILHESARLSSCEIRLMLHDAIDCNKKGQNGFLIVI